MNKNVINPVCADDMHFIWGLSENASGERFEQHCHEEYELLHFIDADFKYVVEDKVYTVKKGDTLLIEPRKYHFLKIEPQRRYERIVCYFSAAFIGDESLPALALKKGEYFSNENFPSIALKFRSLKAELMRAPQRYHAVMIKALIIQLLVQIISEETAPSTPSNDSLCSKAVRYIGENLTSIRTTDDIASALYVSKSSLQHAFRRYMGISVMQYLRVKRLFAARSLISDGMTLRDSTEKVGFSDYTTFYRSFKKHFGYPPSNVKITDKENSHE